MSGSFIGVAILTVQRMRCDSSVAVVFRCAPLCNARILSVMSVSSTHRWVRLAKRAAIIIILLVVGVLVGAVLMIDSIARAGIAAAGTHALGTKTAVREASIGLVSGHTAIRGIEVDNPAGYADAKFLSLDEVSVDAGLSSFLGDRIVIDRVSLSGLTLDLEKHSDGTLNANVIAAHLEKTTKSDHASATSVPAAEAAESKEVIVKELRLEKVRVNLRNLVGGKDGVVEVNLPDIVLRDLSSKGGIDVLASEVSGVVVGSVLQAVVASNIEGLGAEVIGGLSTCVNGIGSAIGGPLKDAVSAGIRDASAALESVGKALEEGTKKLLDETGKALQEGVGNALDGIFGGKKQ